MNAHIMQDAQQVAMSFLIRQASLIEPTVYAIRYQDIQYPSLIPVDTSAPEWIQSVTYFSMDSVGQAQWFNGNAHDVPKVELTREKFETTVSMAAIGYGYNLEELGTAQLLGMNLSNDKASSARRVAEEKIDQVAFIGDAGKGFSGLVNASTPTATTAPADGTGSATTFVSKTPDQILRDINGQLTGIFTGTLGAEIADTLLSAVFGAARPVYAPHRCGQPDHHPGMDRAQQHLHPHHGSAAHDPRGVRLPRYGRRRRYQAHGRLSA
ncbi:hypothetical protein ACVILI_003132 [Mesorhizobium sp. USDA 4775]